MATLHEYFVKDGSQSLTVHQTWPILTGGAVVLEVIARLHLDFEANATYASFYFPASDKVTLPEAIALNSLPKLLNVPDEQVSVTMSIGNEGLVSKDLVFTGRVYLYSERPVPKELREKLESEARAQGHSLVFRSVDYVRERDKWQKPRAFVSHDSRDKKDIAELLALQMLKFQTSVWYDEFSLKVGDSLRESIERGLKETEKCILILTPNFLRNGGWAKREYDSIFSRELVENKKVILPVWNLVTREDVYEYSPILADRFAAQWSEGAETVARKLIAAIGP